MREGGIKVKIIFLAVSAQKFQTKIIEHECNFVRKIIFLVDSNLRPHRSDFRVLSIFPPKSSGFMGDSQKPPNSGHI